MTGRSRWPVPTAEEIVTALERKGGGPTTVGPLAREVCAVMGVDTSGCPGSYELRRVMSWTGYLRRLKELAAGGRVVAMTLAEWRALSGGTLPMEGGDAVHAYATVEVARLIGAVADRVSADRAALARRAACQRVLEEHRDLVKRYEQEWLRRNPAPPEAP